jgi:hypothetical protein
VCYYALVSSEYLLKNGDLTKIDILKFSDVKSEEMFYDHYTILEYSKARLQAKLKYSNIAREILPEKFTFSELQNVYE